MDPAEEEKFLDRLFEDPDNDKLVLPTRPEVALKVRDTIDDEKSSLSDVAKLISNDLLLNSQNYCPIRPH